MFKYAQIDSGKVSGLSELHSEVIHVDLIKLDENGEHHGRVVKLGDLWSGAQFTDATEAAQ